jgi:nucleoside-diphosphate-sugar epimerase
MKVVVTGGSGRLGRYVTRELAPNHEVTVFDRVAPEDGTLRFHAGDILSIEDCRRAFAGSEAVVHLAAIPHPMSDPAETVFRINTMGTFNVHQAACEAGMRKVVHASTNSIYGFHFRKDGAVPFPDYLPIDEDHPQRPADPYGLSKKLGEEIAMSFSRQFAIATVAVRICWVWFPQNINEYIAAAGNPESFMGYWSWVDCRDAATAFRLALEAEGLSRFESFLISSSDNGTLIETRDLVRRYLSERIEQRKPLHGRASLFDSAKARGLLGYEPRHTADEVLGGRSGQGIQ